MRNEQLRPTNVDKQNIWGISARCGRFDSKCSSILCNFLAASLISVLSMRKTELSKAVLSVA
jgi:hypothetical protein